MNQSINSVAQPDDLRAHVKCPLADPVLSIVKTQHGILTTYRHEPGR
jgi:hypothetical protein